MKSKAIHRGIDLRNASFRRKDDDVLYEIEGDHLHLRSSALIAQDLGNSSTPLSPIKLIRSKKLERASGNHLLFRCLENLNSKFVPVIRY